MLEEKLSIIPAFLLLGFLFISKANAVVILQYHHVSETTPRSTSITPDLFQEHLDYLKEKHFSVLALPKLIELLKNKRELPDKAVVITFDDGYQSIYTEAFPRLKKEKFPFTVFVQTRPIEQKLNSFMSWKQLRELTAHGASIGNHSNAHSHMIRRLVGESEVAWEKRVRQEIQMSQKLITLNIGHNLKAFAYPYGEYDASLIDILNDLDYVGLGQQSGAVDHRTNLALVPRFPLGGRYGEIEEFKIKVNSLPLPVKSVQLLNAYDQKLESHILSTSFARPKMLIELEDSSKNLNVNCFLSTEGVLKRKVVNSNYLYEPQNSLPVGRSRYNCTAQSPIKGRFYWFSQLFFRKQIDGSWYREK